ncbi:MAG: phosphoribosylanthranilate isomerase, partial [Chloroflexi bacterium]|nr:phosphoribosylanthranilate isomerase [Chloroflexota bacterium]
FVESVRRQLQPDEAAKIIELYRSQHFTDGPKIVGLFANQDIEDVNRIIRLCKLDYAQLCGDEPPEYWDSVDAGVIRQIKVGEGGSIGEITGRVMADVEAAVSRGHRVMLDKHVDGLLGGTGRAFDWEVAGEIARSHEILLAGGLTPDNVADAISIARPWGVDVSSGVETDGVKDVAKIRAFAREVKWSEGR